MSKLIKKFIENHGQEVFNEIETNIDTYISRFDNLVSRAEAFRKFVSEIDSNNVPSKAIKDFFLDIHTTEYMKQYPDANEELIREGYRSTFSNEYISDWFKMSHKFTSDVVELLLLPQWVFFLSK